MSDLVSRIIEVFTKTGRWGRMEDVPVPPTQEEIDLTLAAMAGKLDEQDESYIEFRGLVLTNYKTGDGTKEVYVYAGTYNEGNNND